jgi:tetratricopeptide (TPR) repeat protein
MRFFENRYVQIFFIVFVSAIAYSNTFHAPFTFDSNPHIPDNPIIKDMKNFFSGVAYREYPRRFIGYFTFALDYRIGGLSVVYYHITNLIIHIFCGILVYFFILQTLKTPYFSKQYAVGSMQTEEERKSDSAYCLMPTAYSQFIALFSALIFVSHPIQTQAVTYIIQRFTSLSTMFYLLSMVMYIKARLIQQSAISSQQSASHPPLPLEGGGLGRGWRLYATRYTLYAISIVSAILAMKTKEIAITLPITIMIYDLFFFKTPLKKRLLFFLPLALTIVIVPLGVLYRGQSLKELFDAMLSFKVQTDMPRSMYLFTQFRVIVTYIRLIFLPINQNLDYDYPIYHSFFEPQVFLSFFFLLSIFGLGIYLLLKSKQYAVNSKQNSAYALLLTPYSRLISFGILWFFVTISPQSSIIPIIDVIFEHRVYLPSVGSFIAIAFASDMVLNKLRNRWHISNRLIIGAAISIIAILTMTTFVRNSIWKSEISLWEDVIKKFPDNARALNNISAAYIDAGRYEDAIKSSKKVLLLVPDNANAYNNIGYAYFKLGKLNEAKTALTKAIENKSDFARAYSNIVVVYIRLGDYKKALEAVREEIKLNPAASAYNNLSVIYQQLGRYPEAVQAANEAVKRDTSYFIAFNNLGMSYLKMDMTNEAIIAFKKSLEIKPDYKEASYNLSIAMSRLKGNK